MSQSGSVVSFIIKGRLEIGKSFETHTSNLGDSRTIVNHPTSTTHCKLTEEERVAVGMKVPGEGFSVKNVNMDFHYEELKDAYVPEAYERLLLDCIQGDATLYARGDAVEAAWEFIDPILQAWKNDDNIPVHGYPAGTWGPENADDLIKGERTWRYHCKNLASDGEYCEL